MSDIVTEISKEVVCLNSFRQSMHIGITSTITVAFIPTLMVEEGGVKDNVSL